MPKARPFPQVMRIRTEAEVPRAGMRGHRLGVRMEKVAMPRKPAVDVSRLVARLHIEIQCCDRFFEFCLVLALMITFLVFFDSLRFHETGLALEAAKDWIPLNLDRAGKVKLQMQELPGVLATLAHESQRINPASPAYHYTPARLFVGKPINITTWLQAINPTIEMNKAFSFAAWVRYRGVGETMLVRKVRGAASGRLIPWDNHMVECWSFRLEPLQFRYATPVDTVHADWTAEHGFKDFSERFGLFEAKFEASEDFFEHGGRSRSAARALSESMKFEKDTEASFHLVAMVYEYDVMPPNARVRFGFDGKELHEAISPSGKQPFPATDCQDNVALLLGDPISGGVEVADLMWFPRALTNEDFHGLYSGGLRPSMATTTAEEVQSAQSFAGDLMHKNAQYEMRQKESEYAHRQWVNEVKKSAAGRDTTTVREFLRQDHTCSSELCEVRVHPIGTWYQGVNQSRGILILKSDAATCSDASNALASSVGQPVTSLRPTSPKALLDRFTVDVSLLRHHSQLVMCWNDGDSGSVSVLPLGTLHLTPHAGDYLELISDASITFEPGHSASPLTLSVGQAAAVTIAFWCQRNSWTAGYLSYMVMKTLTTSPSLVSNNALWALYTPSGNPWWWKHVYVDGTATPWWPLTQQWCDPDLKSAHDYMHHYAYVHLASEQRAALYVDGELCATFLTKPDKGLNASRIFEDGPGNITVASGLSGVNGRVNEWTGVMKQFRYYERELSFAEIRSLASSKAHRECQPLEEMKDEARWRDVAGKSCYDYFVFDQKGGCTKEAELNCPIACSSVRKCYRRHSSIPRVQHFVPRRKFGGPAPRFCLDSRTTTQQLLDRCAQMTLEERLKEKQNAPWAEIDEEVLDGNLMCRRMLKLLRGAESCPLNLTDFQQRWRSGDDWTLLWSGGNFIAYCSMLAPTSKAMYTGKSAFLYTNVSTGTYAAGPSAGESWHWAALSVSKSKGKVIYYRNGRGAEAAFTPLDPCPIEAFKFEDIDNLRFIPGFLSMGEMTQRWYREQQMREYDYEFVPWQSDLDQFKMSSSAFFRPYTLPMWNLLPPIIFETDVLHGQQCTDIASNALKIAKFPREIHTTCQGSDSCIGGAQILSSHCSTTEQAFAAHGPENADDIVGFQGKHGRAFDLSHFQRVVTYSNDQLRIPYQLLDPQAQQLSLMFTLWVEPRDVVFVLVGLNRDTILLKGVASLWVFRDPHPAFLALGITSMVIAVVVFSFFSFTWVQRKRRLANIHHLSEMGIKGSKPLKNLEHVESAEELYCLDPIARWPIESETIFSMVAAAFAVCAIPLAITFIYGFQNTLTTKVTASAGTDTLTTRVQLAEEIADGMQRIKVARTVCLLSGLALCLSCVAFAGFHLRTAVVVRSLKGSISPMSHFLFIFCSSVLLVSFLMYLNFSAEHEDYATPGDAVNAQTDFILGSRPHTDASETSVNIATHVFVTVFFMIVLINMFLAIILDSYSKETARVEDIKVEYSLFYDAWLACDTAWRFRWSNQRKWALAHILASTESDKKVLKSEIDFLALVGEQHPQVLVRNGQHGNILEFSDPVYGTFVFTQQELQQYFCHVRTWDVLWPDGDKGCIEACASSSHDSCDVFDAGMQAPAEDVALEGLSLDTASSSNSDMPTPLQNACTNARLTDNI